MPEDIVIRWIWGYDTDGNPCTEAEPIGHRWCERCKTIHPVVDLDVVNTASARKVSPTRYAVSIRPLVPAAQLDLKGWASSEFPPD